jgi:DNA repair exonuclease SbcCD ATPase subunit
MIIFEKVRFKNFLSFGNTFTEINLNASGNTCIVGKNGSGKSSFMDAITYALFGKSYRLVNKPQLVNSVNEKDCLVEIEFKIGKLNWKVRRGQKPSVFEIYKNDILLDQNASIVDQQKWFEQNVLKMNYRSFTQIVVLGNSNFTPFMQLPAASRREVIEELLDIKIFSSMNGIIKDKIKTLKEEIKILEIKKDSLTDKVKMQSAFIYDLEKSSNTEISNKLEKIKSISSNIKDIEQEIEDLISISGKLNDELKQFSGASGRLKKLGTIKGKLTQKVSTINENHNFFVENSICPTCTQSITESLKEEKIKEYQDSLTELKNAYDEIKKSILEEEDRENNFSNISNKILELNHNISKNNLKINQGRTQIEEIKEEIKSIKENVENKNIEHHKLKIIENELNSTKEEYVTKKETIEYNEYISYMLKDGGVKSKIIRKYLPLINQQVNYYLKMMDFYINFNLDEEFNESIKTPVYEDFSYSSFSEGQRQRINLALLFTWRDVAKIKNSTNVNILILDEVFDSSLDSSGTSDFLRIIKGVIKNSNVFVISHKDGIQEKFDNVLEFEKKGNFSSMSYQNAN